MKNLKYNVLSVLLIFIFVIFFYYGVGNVQKTNENESFEILSDAIKRSTVQCYAIEGVYPPNIEYLEKNYGLVVDHNSYVISYNVFASNIMPEITIYLK